MIIPIDGEFNKNMVKQFKISLRRVLPTQREIRIRINSHGGDVESMAIMNGFVYYFTQYKYHFIAEIEYAESSAMLFAVNMHERIVCDKSFGAIHLPESKDKSTKIQQTKHFISIFEKQTKMDISNIERLNNVMLSSTDLLDLGIATKKVPFF